jgi:hypothetical protein
MWASWGQARIYSLSISTTLIWTHHLTFKLLFRGNLPKNLATRDLSGWLNRVGVKRKFNLDDSWIPRF